MTELDNILARIHAPAVALAQPSPCAAQLSAAPKPLANLAVAEPARQHDFSSIAPGFALRLFLHLRDANKAGLRVGLFEGLRTEARQRWLYAQGRTRPGPRVTNVNDPRWGWHFFGLAGDVAFLSSAGDWYWPATEDSRWRKLKELGAKYGLTTGLDWHSQDAPHHQPANLKTTPSDIARSTYASKGIYEIWRITGHLTVPDSILQLI